MNDYEADQITKALEAFRARMTGENLDVSPFDELGCALMADGLRSRLIRSLMEAADRERAELLREIQHRLPTTQSDDLEGICEPRASVPPVEERYWQDGPRYLDKWRNGRRTV